jgi:hypothetical protein
LFKLKCRIDLARGLGHDPDIRRLIFPGWLFDGIGKRSSFHIEYTAIAGPAGNLRLRQGFCSGLNGPEKGEYDGTQRR